MNHSSFAVVKKEYCNMTRRLKLLTPLFEEIRDSKEAIPEESSEAMVPRRKLWNRPGNSSNWGSERCLQVAAHTSKEETKQTKRKPERKNCPWLRGVLDKHSHCFMFILL